MGEFTQLKSAPTNTTIENTRTSSAIEAAGEAAGKAALMAASKLSAEGNVRNEATTPKKVDAATTPNTMDNFFKDAGAAGNGKTHEGAEAEKKLDKDPPTGDAVKNPPADVMKAINEEKERIKSAIKNGAEGAAAAVKKLLPDLEIH